MAKKNSQTNSNQYYQDITKTGLQTYRQLQAQNKLDDDIVELYKETENLILRNTKLSDYQANPILDTPGKVESNLARTKTAFGESVWDNNTVNEDEFQHLEDIRAENQGSLMQLTSGIGNGVVVLILAAVIYFIFKLFTKDNNKGNK